MLKRHFRYQGFILIILLFTAVIKPFTAYADETEIINKQYGILIADSKNIYTWYDLNDNENGVSIEITANKKIMVPAWKFASLIPDLKYSYNKTSRVMTLTNTKNGRKITCTVNSLSCMYYSSSSSKGTLKEMPYKMYVSKTSNAVMISADALKWVMNHDSGYKYYKSSDMQAKGYDTYQFSAVFTYNPYDRIY